MKLKCFTWLVVRNRILTWDNLVKRGSMGPSICYLYKSDFEDGLHLFLNCPFIHTVWKELSTTLPINYDVNRDLLFVCLCC